MVHRLSRARWRVALVTALVTSTLSCGGDTPTEQPGQSLLTVVSGSGQQAVVGAELAQLVRVELVDSRVRPIAGKTITATVATGGGSMSPVSGTTNADGEVTFRWRLGTTAGVQTVTFSASDARSAEATALAVPGAAATITVASGNGQTGVTSRTLSSPIVVQVRDAFGNAVPGATVSFAAIASGFFTPQTATTASDGRATAEWTLGSTAGAHAATATVAGVQSATLAATARAIGMFDHRVIDAEYARTLDRIITISANPSRLHIVDPETGTSQSIALASVPTAVAVQPDGQFAAVGHAGSISYVNLSTRAVQRVYTLTADVLDIILPGNGWVYAFPAGAQPGFLRSIDLASGAETQSAAVNPGTVGRLHPARPFIYAADPTPPARARKFSIATGAATWMYDSPYTVDFGFGANLWLSDEGFRLFSPTGSYFRTPEIRDQDMTLEGTLPGMTSVQWVIQATGRRRVFVLPGSSGQAPGAAELRVYHYIGDTMDSFRMVPLPEFIIGESAFRSHGRFVFLSRNTGRTYVLLQADPSSGLALDWGWAALYTDDIM